MSSIAAPLRSLGGRGRNSARSRQGRGFLRRAHPASLDARYVQRTAGAAATAQHCRRFEHPLPIQIAAPARPAARELRSNRCGPPGQHRNSGWPASCGYNCSISTRLPQLLTRALFSGNRISPKCVASAASLTVTVVEALPDPPLLSVTVAVTVTCLDCGRLRSRVEGDRSGVELSVGTGTGNRALGRSPAIGKCPAAIGTAGRCV